MITLTACGFTAVIFPNLTQEIADIVGVGRGADLIFYLFILMSMIAIFNLHLRLRATMDSITDLTRELAILSARQPDDGNAHAKHDKS
jgi:hypothetical protein